MITLSDQIIEIKRELAERSKAYPKFVQASLLKQAKADLQMARLRAVLHTVQVVKELEDELKAIWPEKAIG
jgi:hypothetical protein